MSKETNLSFPEYNHALQSVLDPITGRHISIGESEARFRVFLPLEDIDLLDTYGIAEDEVSIPREEGRYSPRRPLLVTTNHLI